MGIGPCSFVRGQCWVTCWHGYWHVPKSTGYDQYSSSALSPILLVLLHQRISTTGMYKMMIIIPVIDNSTIGNQYHMYLCSLQDWGDVQEPSRHPCSCSQCTTSTKCRIGSWTCFWRTQAQDYGIWEASHGIYLFWLSTTPSLQLRRQVCKVDWSYANTSFGWWQKIGSRSIQACSQQVCFNNQPYITLYWIIVISYQIPLCIEYPAHTIAAGCIYLASMLIKSTDPSFEGLAKGQPWDQLFCSRMEDIEGIHVYDDECYRDT